MARPGRGALKEEGKRVGLSDSVETFGRADRVACPLEGELFSRVVERYGLGDPGALPEGCAGRFRFREGRLLPQKLNG